MSTTTSAHTGTEIVLTGTGVPHPRPGTAGAGVLVRHGDVALQFDAGRSTVVRLMEAGTPPYALSALFLTHVHSDHVVDVPDLVMSRWVQQQVHPTEPLVVVAPAGAPERFVRRMLDAYEEDLALRIAHVGAAPIEVDLRPFPVASSATEVWRSDDGRVRVLSVGVHHEPVPDAVAYRVETPDGVVVISGDTRVCAEVELLAAGADVVVHEACRATALAHLVAGTRLETIFSYHADTVGLGAMAARAGVPHLVLTHLIPPLEREGDAEAFAADVCAGGFEGVITVGRDLTAIHLPPITPTAITRPGR